MNQKTYTTPDVSILTGVSERKLNDWRTRGFIFGDVEKGKWARYSFGDAFRICVMLRLVSLGQSIRRASHIAMSIFDAELYDPKESAIQTYLVVAADPIRDDEEDDVGFPRWLVVEGGDDPQRPKIPLAEEKPEAGETHGLRRTLATRDFICVNLSDMVAKLDAAIEALDEGGKPSIAAGDAQVPTK